MVAPGTRVRAYGLLADSGLTDKISTLRSGLYEGKFTSHIDEQLSPRWPVTPPGYPAVYLWNPTSNRLITRPSIYRPHRLYGQR
jgi:hypothetical protein